MANTIKIFLFWILGLINSDYFGGNGERLFSLVNIFSLIAYLVSLSGVLLFLELLMLGFLGLDSNTSFNIAERSKDDSEQVEIHYLMNKDNKLSQQIAFDY